MHGDLVCIVFPSKQTLSGKEQPLHQNRSVIIHGRRGHHRDNCVVLQRAARLYWQYVQPARTQVLSNAMNMCSRDYRHRCRSNFKSANQHNTFAPLALAQSLAGLAHC